MVPSQNLVASAVTCSRVKLKVASSTRPTQSTVLGVIGSKVALRSANSCTIIGQITHSSASTLAEVNKTDTPISMACGWPWLLPTVIVLCDDRLSAGVVVASQMERRDLIEDGTSKTLAARRRETTTRPLELALSY
ncbi:hypothetical protein N8Z08_00195 [bacterium]|nr:hypothetical protein [bacterium]